MYSCSQEPDPQVSKYEFTLFQQLRRRLPAMHLPPPRGERGRRSPGHRQGRAQPRPARRKLFIPRGQCSSGETCAAARQGWCRQSHFAIREGQLQRSRLSHNRQHTSNCFIKSVLHSFPHCCVFFLCSYLANDMAAGKRGQGTNNWGDEKCLACSTCLHPPLVSEGAEGRYGQLDHRNVFALWL